MSLDVDIEHILPEYPSKAHIQWVLDFDNKTGTKIHYDIQRSGSPESGWKTIAEDVSPPAYTDNYEDETEDNINQLGLNKEIWYRVFAYTDDGREAYSDPVDNENNTPYTAETKPGVGVVPRQRRIPPNAETNFDRRNTSNKRIRKHHLHRKFLRNYITGLRVSHGTEIAVLKRKHFGIRCSECYDETTDEVLYSNCENCFGTGWEEGYFDPIFTLGKVGEQGTQERLGPAGESDQSGSRIEMVSFPRIEQGDIIVKTDEGDRYVARNIRDKKLRQRTVKQIVTAEEMARTSAKYDIPINTSSRGLHT